jgi:DNA transformation protein
MDTEFVEYALRQLQVLGPVVARRMFGGHGLYCDERFFAVIDNDALYFKVDALSRLDYVAAGMGPFAPLPGKKMDGYYEVPLDVLESRAKLAQWGKKALAAAEGAAAKKDGKKHTAGSLEILGSVSQRWLADAGIRTRADLERSGSVAAFRKVAAAGHAPSVNLLYALEGALLGLRPDRLSAEIRKNLLERAGIEAPKKPAKPRTKRSR